MSSLNGGNQELESKIFRSTIDAINYSRHNIDQFRIRSPTSEIDYPLYDWIEEYLEMIWE